ncbi:MAG: M48 family metallopeptidase [Oscillospiraceae bacterium]|nr:M48 family metallopeptidase [Oscillospiraceae bacterium]
MEYKVIRHHRRKRLAVTVTPMGEVIVKAPLYASEGYIEKFIISQEKWIKEQQKYYEDAYHHRILVSQEEKAAMKKQLLPQMQELVDRYAAMMGAEIKSVKITSAEKRWGSCGKDGAICFSYRLALVSQRCREYLVVHELCHLKQFNHSKEFYSLVEQYMPHYREAEKELNGYYIHLRQ